MAVSKEVDLIPTSYSEWYECITVKCKIPMTRSFIQERLSILEDLNQKETKKFSSLYGEQHLNEVVSWYRLALNKTK